MESTIQLNAYLGPFIMNDMAVILHQIEMHTFAQESTEHET
jgi:hypothetical protein